MRPEKAVYATNCTIWPKGLFSVLLVFGAIRLPTKNKISPKKIEIYQLIDVTSKDSKNEQARKRIVLFLIHMKVPNVVEASIRLREFLEGYSVFTYGTKTNKWEGTHRLLSMEGETEIVKTKIGEYFPKACVKASVRPKIWTEVEKEEQGM